MADGTMRPVVVGVDGSAESLAALDLAAEEAAGRVAPLVLVYATEVPARGGEVLDIAAARVLSEHPGLSVAGEAVAGPAVAALLDRAIGAGLLVVGHRSGHSRSRVPLGSVAMEVVTRSPVPVVVHRPLTVADVPLPRPVVVGVTGAEPVIEFAFEAAALRGAPLHAVQVRTGSGIGAEPALADLVAAWAEKYPDVTVCQTVRYGLDVTVALTAASRSAQLVVIGSSRRGTGSAPTMGTVGYGLIQRAGCPVAVVHL